jgi:hypothetical protein
MPFYTSLIVLAALPAIALANPVERAITQGFTKPAFSPFSASTNYVGNNNGTLVNNKVTAGKVFDRFIQIWLENTDFQTAASTPEFQTILKDGLLLDAYYAVTHVSRRPHNVRSNPRND